MLTDHHAFSGIAVSDMAAARRFYADTLGLNTSDGHGLMWLHHTEHHKTLVYEQPAAHPCQLHPGSLRGRADASPERNVDPARRGQLAHR